VVFRPARNNPPGKRTFAPLIQRGLNKDPRATVDPLRGQPAQHGGWVDFPVFRPGLRWPGFLISGPVCPRKCATVLDRAVVFTHAAQARMSMWDEFPRPRMLKQQQPPLAGKRLRAVGQMTIFDEPGPQRGPRMPEGVRDRRRRSAGKRLLAVAEVLAGGDWARAWPHEGLAAHFWEFWPPTPTTKRLVPGRATASVTSRRKFGARGPDALGPISFAELNFPTPNPSGQDLVGQARWNQRRLAKELKSATGVEPDDIRIGGGPSARGTWSTAIPGLGPGRGAAGYPCRESAKPARQRVNIAGQGVSGM